MAIIITAFGAWIGAGAAYFFGRENQREASKNLLEMGRLSLTDSLAHITVKEITPKPIDWTVKKSDELKKVWDKLKAEVERWFVPIVDETGVLATVIHEEAVWRFMIDQSEKGIKEEDTLKQPVSKLLDYIDETKKNTPGFEALRDKYVSVTPDENARDANQMLQKKEAYLAIVIDEKGKPISYITTGDLRRVLLKIGG